MSGLRPFINIPRDIREWTRWTKEALIDGSVGTDQIEDDAVTMAKLANLAARSVIGNATAATANPAAITASADDRVLARTGGTLAFQQLTSGMFPNSVVPDAALSGAIPIASTGSYTGTLTGCTTSPTGTISYSKVGNVVVLFIPNITATSNSVAATITGPAPSAIRPASTQTCITRIQDNSAIAFGLMEMDSAGLITLRSNASAGAFTAANTKGTAVTTVTYTL